MSSAPSAALSDRHGAVRAALVERGVDALVVLARSNILYLTNFAGSSAIVVITADRVHFITDFRYVTAIEAAQRSAGACPGLDLTAVTSTYDAALAGIIAKLGVGQLGFESAHLTVNRYHWLLATLGDRAPRLVPLENVVERARARKDAYELATLREAARRLSEVARGVFGEIAAGRTETDIALAIDFRIRRAGFERTAFDTIVAAGPNAALPHAHPGTRTLNEGDLVVLDFGGVYDSYCVDLTRTVSVGRASSRAREVYGAVLDAHDRAIAAVRPGQSRFAIDGAARDALAARGFGEAFGHGTGHGLGIDVHEDPKITRRVAERDGGADDDAVTAGMVFTIEPGAYFPDWGGVRIEDDVLVTASGVETLTDVTTELLEL